MDYERLLEMPIWQMTGREFFALTQYANNANMLNPEQKAELCTGIHALAEQLGCCESTIYMLRREGVLDEAVKSQIGKRIVFDVTKARELAEAFQQEQRTARRNDQITVANKKEK